MKGSPGFGTPKRKRVAMQFGYDTRPSFWQGVKSNSHLVIAAVGTAALLGVAGTALWLAMPADREAFAQAEQPANAAAVPAKAEATKAQAIGQPATIASTAKASAAVAAAAGVTLQAAETQDDLSALPTNDPRWSGSAHRQARAATESAARARKEAAPATTATPPPLPTPEEAASVAAYQPTKDAPAEEPHAKPDKAETAAIPAAKPAKPTADDHDGESGRILRAVTMRSGPKKAASAIGTIPAKTTVQVLSCKSWCNVVYKGKRGWIYKSFLKRGG